MQGIGLVAHYDFSEGAGALLHDVSGNGNDGQIFGAQWIKRKKGYCLEFDGIDNFVDCGDHPSLDLRDAVTLEAWVLLDAALGEAGIAGKHYESFFLTYYSDGRSYWYINHSGVANNVSAPLLAGSWHHLSAAFDGMTLSLYIDGKLTATQPSVSAPKVNQGNHFYIGVTDPFNGAAPYLKGQVAEVRVYARALSAAEIEGHFQTGEQQLEDQEYAPATAAVEIQHGNILVGAGQNGQVRVSIGCALYLAEASYSYAGNRVGWNHLAETGRSSEPGWSPSVKTTSPSVIVIEAKSKDWTLRRRVQIHDGTVSFEDHLINPGGEPAGLIISNRLTGSLPFTGTFTPESADNPTIFLSGKTEALGILIEDDLSRLNFEPSLGVPANQARFRLSNIVLEAGKSYRIQWTLYSLPKIADYFEFVNRIRRDWGANFTVDGPFAFFDANPVTNQLVCNPSALKDYLVRKRLKMVALYPWLDYDPRPFDHVLSRQEYKSLMQTAITALKAADPNIQCLGSIEADWVNISLDDIDPAHVIPRDPNPALVLKTAETALIDNANLPWKDSVKRDDDGNLTLELYNQPKVFTSLGVYPRVGNYQYSFLVDQIQFLLDDVGTDGFYIDQFSQSGWVSGGIRSYDSQDATGGDVSSATGALGARYTNCDLAGRAARVNLCKYALDKGKTVVCNTWATSAGERAIPANRFSETWGFFDPVGIDISNFPDTGAEPNGVTTIFRGNLASPIALGTQQKQGVPTVNRLMKAVIAYLRHGMLYYHYHLPDLGVGEGSYGPVNLMFPITPVALHKGWIEGKERIITAVSGVIKWPHDKQPHVHRFDLTGQEITPHGFAITNASGSWKVAVDITDWAEVVVVD